MTVATSADLVTVGMLYETASIANPTGGNSGNTDTGKPQGFDGNYNHPPADGGRHT